MKSNKQRRAQILARRRDVAKQKEARRQRDAQLPEHRAPCNSLLLAPYNSYGLPDFVERGYYQDMPFECARCGKQEVWRATQQKWWYEVAKGQVWSVAKWCRPCRRAERDRSAEARRTHLEGVARKQHAK